VVGGAYTAGGEQHAFLYDAAGLHDINPSGSTDSVALAVNSAGQVVGYASDATTGTYAFVYDGSGTHQLSLGGAPAEIQYFTDSGVVAGQAYTSTGAYQAFLYDGGTTHALALPDTTYSFLSGVNDAGAAVGLALSTTYEQHAFLYDAAGMHDLVPDSAFSMASAISAAGQCVGFADTPDGEAQYVFSYRDGVLTDLSGATAGSGYELYVPVGVSADGQVVCNGAVAGAGRALLLTPTPPG
jgi:probable HAF family extracellular repeat protein